MTPLLIQPGQEKVIFEETCGDAVPLTTKIKINAYTDWDNSNLTFFDRFAGEYQNGDVRKSSTTTNHVWFPASTETMNKSAALKISGFDVSGYTNLVLTYEITANAAADQNIIKVDCGGTTMEVPSASLSQNVFSTVTLSNVPDGIEYIEFISDETNTFGFRIDSIKLVGTAK